MGRPAIRVLSIDLDHTLYRPRAPLHPVVRRLRHPNLLEADWWIATHVRAWRAFFKTREQLRSEPPCGDAASLRSRLIELMAAELHQPSHLVSELVRRIYGVMPRVLALGCAPFEGALTTLRGLAARGIRLAVLSDFPLDKKLRYLGLDQVPWSARVACDDIGAIKPHPASFEALAQRLDVAPESVVHLGDREDADVAGALAAGMRAWLFSHVSPATRAERVVHRWDSTLIDAVLSC